MVTPHPLSATLPLPSAWSCLIFPSSTCDFSLTLFAGALEWPDVTQRRGVVLFVPKTSRHVVVVRHCVVEVVV